MILVLVSFHHRLVVALIAGSDDVAACEFVEIVASAVVVSMV